MSSRAYVLLHGECEPTVLGVYERDGDARVAAELREGCELVWMGGLFAGGTDGYKIVETERHSHADVKAAYMASVKQKLGVPR